MEIVRKVWRAARWPLGVLVLLYIGLVIYRVPAMFEKDKTEQVVAQIHSQKITLADVQGTALPPPPNEQENNATVAGLDKNNNGIRDDVELAIFAKYPNSARVRAAELQYAMALQLMITTVFNTDSWIAAAQEISRGSECVGLTIPDKDLSAYLARTKEVKTLVLNTEARKTASDKAYDFTTSNGDLTSKSCDIDLNTLQN